MSNYNNGFGQYEGVGFRFNYLFDVLAYVVKWRVHDGRPPCRTAPHGKTAIFSIPNLPRQSLIPSSGAFCGFLEMFSVTGKRLKMIMVQSAKSHSSSTPTLPVKTIRVWRRRVSPIQAPTCRTLFPGNYRGEIEATRCWQPLC